MIDKLLKKVGLIRISQVDTYVNKKHEQQIVNKVLKVDNYTDIISECFKRMPERNIDSTLKEKE